MTTQQKTLTVIRAVIIISKRVIALGRLMIVILQQIFNAVRAVEVLTTELPKVFAKMMTPQVIQQMTHVPNGMINTQEPVGSTMIAILQPLSNAVRVGEAASIRVMVIANQVVTLLMKLKKE